MVQLKTIAINLTVLLLFLNATPGLLMASGTAADIGISPDVGGDESAKQVDESASQVEATGGFGQTLFGLYTTVASAVSGIVNFVTAGPTMLTNAGLPGWLVGFIFVPQYIIVGATIIYVLAGRSL